MVNFHRVIDPLTLVDKTYGTVGSGLGVLFSNSGELHWKNSTGDAQITSGGGVGGAVWSRSGTDLRPATDGDTVTLRVADTGTLYGSAASGKDLTLLSTSHGTKGNVLIGETTCRVTVGTTNITLAPASAGYTYLDGNMYVGVRTGVSPVSPGSCLGGMFNINGAPVIGSGEIVSMFLDTDVAGAAAKFVNLWSGATTGAATSKFSVNRDGDTAIDGTLTVGGVQVTGLTERRVEVSYIFPLMDSTMLSENLDLTTIVG